jgi:hypothetical protein
MKINNINELIDFIENHEISMEDLNKLTINTLGAMIVLSNTKDEVIQSIKKYWLNYGHKPKQERPILLDVHDPLEQEVQMKKFIDSL